MPKASIGVSIVIVNYRQPTLTIECLESIEKHPPRLTAYSAIIVDNCSGDGSAEKIRNEIIRRGWEHWAEVIENPTNNGFSAGNNLGILHRPSDYYLLLNSDARVEHCCIDRLVLCAESDSRVGLVGPRLQWPDGRGQVSSFRFRGLVSEFLEQASTGPLDRLFRKFVVPQGVCIEPTNTSWVSFACVLLRHSLVADIGLMDEDYFLYFEDIDYARRAHENGWLVHHEPRAAAVHLRGGSSNVKSDIESRTAPAAFYYESRSRYFAKFYGGRRGVLMANIAWLAGAAIGRSRSFLDGRPRGLRGEAGLIWTRWRHPLAPPTWPRT